MCLCEDERMHACACLCARVRTCACMRVYPCARARALVRARARRRWGAGIESRAGGNGIMFRVYALDIKAVIEDGDAPWQLTACAGRGRLELAQLESAGVRRAVRVYDQPGPPDSDKKPAHCHGDGTVTWSACQGLGGMRQPSESMIAPPAARARLGAQGNGRGRRQ
jgi:hypothetical protein